MSNDKNYPKNIVIECMQKLDACVKNEDGSIDYDATMSHAFDIYSTPHTVILSSEAQGAPVLQKSIVDVLQKQFKDLFTLGLSGLSKHNKLILREQLENNAAFDLGVDIVIDERKLVGEEVDFSKGDGRGLFHAKLSIPSQLDFTKSALLEIGETTATISMKQQQMFTIKLESVSLNEPGIALGQALKALASTEPSQEQDVDRAFEKARKLH